MKQIVLPVRMPRDAAFANFVLHPGVQLSAAQLQDALLRPALMAFLHGPAGCGRTHLLQAACHQVEYAGGTIAYLPLRELAGHPASELVADLESCALVCLDDLDAVVGRAEWDEALFHLFNRVLHRHACLLVAATLPPSALPVGLADLRSRLQSMLVLPLAPPDDAGRAEVLAGQARARGMTLEPGVAEYILGRAPRALPELIAILERLDLHSLEAGRRLSIPFVRETMGWPRLS